MREVHLAHAKAFGAEVVVVARREFVMTHPSLCGQPVMQCTEYVMQTEKSMCKRTGHSNPGRVRLQRFVSIRRLLLPRTMPAMSL